MQLKILAFIIALALLASINDARPIVREGIGPTRAVGAFNGRRGNKGGQDRLHRIEHGELVYRTGWRTLFVKDRISMKFVDENMLDPKWTLDPDLVRYLDKISRGGKGR